MLKKTNHSQHMQTAAYDINKGRVLYSNYYVSGYILSKLLNMYTHLLFIVSL